MKGRFITIEGCEGVGKSTQTNLLKTYLELKGVDAVFTREPGGTEISEQIRSIILNPDNKEMDGVTELMLYAAARRQHTEQFIKSNLNSGKIVVCDRYIDSTTAYQGYARGLDFQMIDKLNQYACGGVNIDLTIFIDVSPKEGFRRKGGADKTDRLENEKLEFFEKVYLGFKDLSNKYPNRIAAVKADGTKFDTHEKIVNLLIDRNII